MDQEKFGNLIKKIRLENNLTQKDFADKYNVTYQAVSKWENGKNMPDTLLIKKICDDFDLKMEDLFNGEVSKKKNYVPIMITLGLIVFLIWGMVIIKCIDSNYEFKTITTSCENFRINGSLAYNTKKATIYISNIEYCGGDNRETFPSISCTLYEEEVGLFKKVDSYVYEGNPITLEKFLKDVKFKVDDYDSICKDRNIHALYIDIIAKDDKERAKRYRVDLEVEDSCK